MDEQRPTSPRRKKRSREQIFKETYLPAVIVCIAFVFILVCVIGSIVRGVQRSQYKDQQAKAAAAAAQAEEERLSQEAERLLSEAAQAASHYGYSNAITILESFSGNINDYPALTQAHEKYTQAKDSLVLWDDPSDVVNLSFQLLIADPDRAFADDTYGSSYSSNFITIDEFTKILQQLYQNDYILVDLMDVTNESGALELYLPQGKQPFILTQTNVNYYTYMTDSDGDYLPDKGADGFASRLIIDANGNISCEYVDAEGNTVTGAYDMVPILESFIETHPDFSYNGARAILAVSGYDGVLGYRTNNSAQEHFDSAYYNQEVSSAKEVANKLTQLGYRFACYTYENAAYGTYTAEQISQDLERWQTEVVPIIGNTDIFVFPKTSDISDNGAAYSGDQFKALSSCGFKYYLGFCTGSIPYYSAHNTYIRMGRIQVTGSALTNNAQLFNGMFEAASVMDNARKEIIE